jgi:hypothetical protein
MATPAPSAEPSAFSLSGSLIAMARLGALIYAKRTRKADAAIVDVIGPISKAALQ